MKTESRKAARNRLAKFNPNAILKAKVTKGMLRIEIGVNTLAYAAEHNPELDMLKVRVVEPFRFAGDVCEHIQRIDTNGETSLEAFLDSACAAVSEKEGSCVQLDSVLL